MTPISSSPIIENWSIYTEAISDPAAGSRHSTATARELNEELGHWTVADLVEVQAELAVAVISLARAGGQPWFIGNDEPTVALLRLSARMALRSPEVSTTEASQVAELLRLRRLAHT